MTVGILRAHFSKILGTTPALTKPSVPSSMWTNSLKLKVLLTMREAFTGSCHWELMIGWAGTDREKLLSV